MAEKDIISTTAKFLSGLDNAEKVAHWAEENIGRIESIKMGYDELIDCANAIPNDSPFLEQMPGLKLVKNLLGEELIPSLEEMGNDYNFARGLIEARGLMLLGQRIKKGEVEKPNDEQLAEQILTTSMDTTPEALAVGTMGHLIERTFFKWAEARNFIPSAGWNKDMFLRALSETMRLRLIQNKETRLTNFFFRSNEDGGLGWLNLEKLEQFREKVKNLV